MTTPTLETIDTQFKQHALERYTTFAGEPIYTLMTPAPAFRYVPQERVDFMLENQEYICQWLQQNSADSAYAMLGFFVDHTLNYLYRHNQFLEVPRQARSRLHTLYARFVQNYAAAACTPLDDEMLRQNLDRVLHEHQMALADFIQALGQHNGSLDFALGEPVCSEYSPDLQLKLLGLSPHDLLEPILDLGCGQDARLVHFLHNTGKTTHGIDRSVDQSEFTHKADWFSFPLKTKRWGTVVSHMAFSTHFLHHHLRRNGHPEQFAQRYMVILQALKPGGCFIYTPGLPFIENLLPQTQYTVERYAIEQPELIPDAVASLVGDVAYTAVITRLF